MDKIEILSKRFRTAIDIAKSENEFYRYFDFKKFPDDCCDMTCDLLGYYLLENGIETRQINGACEYDDSRRHVWLETNDKKVIDITCDQFNDEFKLSQIIDSVYIGEENEVHKIFSVDRCVERNTNFTDSSLFEGFNKQPNFRQKKLIELYEIIEKYL